MADAGVSHLIMEVSSHALAQQRIGPLRFDYGLFTNLSQDHLDYHSDLDDYFQAKALLFENHLKDDGCAVICRAHDDSQRWSKQLLALCEQRHIDVVTCGPAHPKICASSHRAPIPMGLPSPWSMVKKGRDPSGRR
jgi:murE/murF fusion protein